jgi:hypothetical protein
VKRFTSFLLLALAVGCSSDPAAANPTPSIDSSTDDTFIAAPDTAPADTGTTPVDANISDVADAPPKFDILGSLSGECGGLLAELTKTTPSLYANTLVFMTGESYSKDTVSKPDGVKMYETANAGGSSGESEVMSFEVLHYCDDASLVKTETEILYAPPDDSGPNSITDILVSIGGKKVGVSVTRAYKPAPQILTDADAKDIIEKKLDGINRSSVRVLAADKWVKQILHVFVANADHEAAVKRVIPTIDPTKRADTIILITRTTGGGFIYCNPDPALGAECPPI